MSKNTVATFDTPEGIEKLNAILDGMTWILKSPEAEDWRQAIAKMVAEKLAEGSIDSKAPKPASIAKTEKVETAKTIAADTEKAEKARKWQIIQDYQAKNGIHFDPRSIEYMLGWKVITETSIREYARQVVFSQHLREHGVKNPWPKASAALRTGKTVEDVLRQESAGDGVTRLAIIKKIEAEKNITFFETEIHKMIRWEPFTEDRIRGYANECIAADKKAAKTVVAPKTPEKEPATTATVATKAPEEEPTAKAKVTKTKPEVTEPEEVSDLTLVTKPANRAERRALGKKKAEERALKTNVGEILEKAMASKLVAA